MGIEPSEEGLKKWLLSMQASRTLAELANTGEKHLLPDIVLSALQNPLLRTVTINEVQHIAGVRAYVGESGCMSKFADNPLENKTPEGMCRVRMQFGVDDEIIVERNVGPHKKDPIERALSEACSRAGSDMARTGDYLGEPGQRFSNLLAMTTRSHGGNFDWTEVSRHKLSEFKEIAIVERARDKRDGKLTFDLILSS
ncbi:MAG: hypothetical protein ACD_81C00222G0003 [uncultured bacterium]|uniref:Uncharacterized protein n=1 Tax=Candidatus Wolfebacteria bacterium GW2011_GWE2_44_13 TaxID=1619017 RepID=A0A0G1HAI6_9BACT|nr:MAG: hypothetical protein ACD_81C00222G0003 [uncultured bacterium]KKT43563.1 MAG: hypothetical protein UW32_C0001G0155 [Candidatus Wolfebacteria bacterium GW2011_GWE2_44_13]